MAAARQLDDVLAARGRRGSGDQNEKREEYSSASIHGAVSCIRFELHGRIEPSTFVAQSSRLTSVPFLLASP